VRLQVEHEVEDKLKDDQAQLDDALDLDSEAEAAKLNEFDGRATTTDRRAVARVGCEQHKDESRLDESDKMQ